MPDPRRTVVRLALSGTLLLGLMAAAPVASAQGEPAFVPYCIDGSEWQAEPGQDLLVVCGWGATTRGLLQMFIANDTKSHVLTDSAGHVVWSLSPSQGAPYWGPLTKGPASDQGIECKGGTFWTSDWEYTVPGLTAGTYTLTTTEVYKHPVNDGYHTCSFEGQPISPTPSKYAAGTVLSVETIVVAAP